MWAREYRIMGTNKVAVLVGDNKQCGIYIAGERVRNALEASGVEAHLIQLPEATPRRVSFLELRRLARSIERYDLVINQHEPRFWGNQPRLSRLNLAWFCGALRGRVK